MMHLYIDKENVESLVQGRKNHLTLYDEFVRSVKKGLVVYYNFSKDEFLKNPYLQAWFTSVKGDGVKTSSDFCPPNDVFPPRPVKTNFLNSCGPDAYRSLYFLCMEEHISKTIQEKQCILIGNVGEEYAIIDKLVALEDKEMLTKDIASWDSYCCPKLPLTDIVLCDDHYFKNKVVYDKNTNEVLTALTQIPKSQINVVIITKEGEIDPSFNLELECKNIKEQIAKKSGLSKGKCNVTILTTFKAHSRHLITNYFRIIHTSCFHLIDNGLKGDVNTDIAPCIKQNANEVTDNLLAFFQSIALSPVQCFGDKESNFLNFS